MHISDVHLGHHRGRDYLTAIVKETNKRNPDLVLITGDLVDAEPALLPGVLAPLSEFKAPVYFVEGNHEKYLGAERTLKLIEEQNVRIMHNEVIETHGIQLIGFDYMNADEDTFDMHPSDHTGTVKSVLAELPLKKDVPSVLMIHSPVGSQYADAAGINLMLAGHTHGGQIFPFSLLSKLGFPLHSGLYRPGNTKVFVSNGAGTFMMRIRLGTFNEINLLRLLPD
jgi:predicted MPP superfamily phosphohydrolase